MGVDTKYIAMIGLKENYNFVKLYDSKNDSDYTYDIEDNSIKNYKNVVFEDYLPPKYEVYCDGMGGRYSCIGKIIDTSEYLDEIRNIDFTPQELQKQIDEVILEFEALKLSFDKEKVKLYIFVYFS